METWSQSTEDKTWRTLSFSAVAQANSGFSRKLVNDRILRKRVEEIRQIVICQQAVAQMQFTQWDYFKFDNLIV